VLLIGIALAKTGISYWGGGAYCADQVRPWPRSTRLRLKYSTVLCCAVLYCTVLYCIVVRCRRCIRAPIVACDGCLASGHGEGGCHYTVTLLLYCDACPCVQVLTSQVPCSGNGQVKLPFGSSEYMGLGFVVFFTLILVELFGSPFMRNVQVRPRFPPPTSPLTLPPACAPSPLTLPRCTHISHPLQYMTTCVYVYRIAQ